MSSITGLSSSTLASLLAAGNNSSDTSQTPLQRAEALAQQAAASGSAGSTDEAALIAQSEQSALTTSLLSALGPSDLSDTSDLFGPAYDLSSDVYDYAMQSVFDQIGSVTPASQWQQIQTPDLSTPGESTSVAPADQISYLQNVATPDGVGAGPSLGTIGTNAGRLVALGSLTSDPNDVQTYSFNLQQAGQLHILAPDPKSSDPTASLGAVHMQVYDSSGNLVGDSDPNSGEAYLNYVKMDQTALPGADMAAGPYTIKLSYDSNAPANAKGDYSLFIESGTDPGRVTYYTTTGAQSSNSAATQPAQSATSFVPALSLLA